MPIQNVGTLIENLVVTECASTLLDRVSPDQALGLATAFAMPPLTEWRPHRQSVGISDDALRRVQSIRGGPDFIDAISACLRRFPDRGPNGALLVAVLAAMRQKPLRVWANDIEDGHYGNGIDSLEAMQSAIRQVVPQASAPFTISVCATPYPDSIDRLEEVIEDWREHSVTALLGFLDPMRYLRSSRPGPYTSPTDHRRWLWRFRGWRSSIVVQFTGNNDAASLSAELESLRSDLVAIGFSHWAEIRRQHYVVSVASQVPELIDAVATKVARSWRVWCDNVPEIKSRELSLERSTEAG